jgi:hypothetical protein
MKKAVPKKPRPQVPDYCDVALKHDTHGEPIWPAPQDAMEAARAFIREW